PRISAMVDVAIISLYNRLTNRMGIEPQKIRRHGAVVAVGELGRRHLGPFSPMGLLFLHTPEVFFEEEVWVSGIVQPLQEAGWEVSFESGRIRDVVDRSLTDLNWMSAMVDSRFISGSRTLVEDLRVSFMQEIQSKRHAALIRSFLEEWQARQSGQQEPECLLEPDLEYSAGSLGELNRIHWAGYLLYQSESLAGMGTLDQDSVKVLQEAQSFLLRVRNHLQLLKGGQETRLEYEAQQEVALSMGYRNQGDFLPVEVMMKELEAHFYEVKLVANRFRDRLTDSIGPRTAHPAKPTTRGLGPGILLESDRIVVNTQAVGGNEEALLEVFRQAVRVKKPLSVEASNWLKSKAHQLPGSMSGKPELRQWLFEIIREETPEIGTVRALYQTSLLPALIPELRQVHALVQHDAFHLYPVHEHHLLTFTELKKLLSGEYGDAHPEVSEWLDINQDQEVFLLAALIHDVGKSGGHGHAQRGADMALRIGERLGLTDAERELLSFLVANHVLLTDSAARRDLDDQQMIQHCTNVIGSVERLKMLMLHAFADMRTTGPRAWELWENLPMLTLYERLLHRLEKGDPDERMVATRLDFLRRRAAELLAEEMTPETLDYHFDQTDSRYLLSVTPDELVRHLRLERKLEQAGLAWHVQARQDNWELTLMSRHPLGLLARVAGALTLHQLDIRKAQTHTKKDGVALQIFEVAALKPNMTISWEQVMTDLQNAMQGRLALEYRLAIHAAKHQRKKGRIPEKPDEVVVDNDSSDQYTIIEVYTTDRMGLLHAITRTMLELRLQVFLAKISTRMDQVADIFYVRTQDGQRVENPEHVEEIKRALLFSLK
ncbi:MAG: HD domain-containing protein, partial [Deltaproteobacteria bacterium]